MEDLLGEQRVLFGKMIVKKIINHEKFKEILIDLKLSEKEDLIKEELLKHDFDIKKEKILKLEQNNLKDNETKNTFNFSIINIFTDGASSGNPGVSGAACIFFDKNNKEFLRQNINLGINTNNYAEYSAILLAVKNIEELEENDFFKDFKIDFRDIKFNFFSDSELMVNQLNKKYKISNDKLKILANEFFEKIKILDINYNIYHIPREKNSLADHLAVLAKNNKIINNKAK